MPGIAPVKQSGRLFKMMKKRLFYGISAIILIAVEVLIALFEHDSFIRPYCGDILVVVVVYCLVRIIVPENCKLLPLYVFFFAALVEILQFFHIVDLLGLGKITFFRILIGGTFDFRDLLCYVAGCVLLGAWEAWNSRRADKK